MGWIDRALATLSPADVARRVSSYVGTVSVEESYAALRPGQQKLRRRVLGAPDSMGPLEPNGPRSAGDDCA